jgi:hypothetical protein
MHKSCQLLKEASIHTRMTTTQKYGLTFYKKAGAFGKPNYFVQSTMPENGDIASHLSYSDSYLAQDQINELNKAINGIRIQEDWGEIMGSTLDIFPSDGTVQIGYTNRKIPTQDFIELLQEWLDFIKSDFITKKP